MKDSYVTLKRNQEIMLIAKLQGGLGNQLFQWAYVRHLSHKYSRYFCLDISHYEDQSEVTPREFALAKLPYLKFKICQEAFEPIKLIRDDFHYFEFFHEPLYSYYLDGYWQSEKYFNGSEQVIRSELRPTNQLVEKFRSIIKDSQKTVSLHVRRTDYITYKEFHPVLDIEYYNKAIALIGEYDNLLIFSDDIDWCKTNFDYKKMLFVEKQDDIDDLWMMSLCSHNIIANSSFSWWGAWLNNNPDKKVIAPKLWFGEKLQLNTGDIIPEGWILI